MPKKQGYYIGLMSGTSMDAIDAALLTFKPFQLMDAVALPIPPDLKKELTEIQTNPLIHLHRLAQLDIILAQYFAKAVHWLLQKSQCPKNDVQAIGSHGHTIIHRPDLTPPVTLQLGDPHTLLAHTHIPVISDFRKADIARQGQGAPLAPLFHQYLFKRYLLNQPLSTTAIIHCIINIGGIANITQLSNQAPDSIIGFDIGPGNTLLDVWCRKQLNQDYDKAGEWAASGLVNFPLLNSLLSDAYFQRPPPKSTGLEYFNLPWLSYYLNQHHRLKAVDVQATLLELTAITIQQAVKRWHPTCIVLCGGGVHNRHLLKRLKTLCAPHEIDTTDLYGVPADWMEAACFAWLAKQTLDKQALNLPPVTGAYEKAILGAIYPCFNHSHHSKVV